MTISFIAAVSKNQVIGKDNDLPWTLPDDMKFFMQTTKGHVVIMGRKNYDSLPEKFKPLPNRTNIVITRQANLSAKDCLIVHSVEEALDVAQKTGEQEAFVIGGAEIFATSFRYSDRLYLTEIAADVEGDIHFPKWDRTAWREKSRRHHPVDERHVFPFDFVVYERVQ